MYKKNSKYKILSLSGFQNFEGINLIEEPLYIHLFFSNGSELKCSLNHKILTKQGYIEAKNLNERHDVKSAVDFIKLKDFKIINEPIKLFDPYNVANGNNYISNSVISHNCKEFLGTGETYVDGEVLTLLHDNTNNEYISRYNNRFRVWKDQEPYYQYVIGADVALGRERDYSGFHVINCYNGEQVAEFYSNKTPINEFAQILATEGKKYNTALIIPERNTIGLNLIDYLLNTEQYENVWMDSKGLFGYQVTQQNKEQLLADMEECIRNKKVLLNSERLIKELLTFIIDENGKVKADVECHDDLVISLALTTFGLLKVIQSTPGLITKLTQGGMNDPLEISRSDYKSTYSKTEEDIKYEKWVLGIK